MLDFSTENLKFQFLKNSKHQNRRQKGNLHQGNVILEVFFLSVSSFFIFGFQCILHPFNRLVAKIAGATKTKRIPYNLYHGPVVRSINHFLKN